jgi:hypothetical protein
MSSNSRPRKPVRSHALRLRLVTESELDGNCRGWEGDTAFRLCNGEVWEQAAFRVRRVFLASPGVRIWRLGDASLLEIEGVRELLPVRLRA